MTRLDFSTASDAILLPGLLKVQRENMGTRKEQPRAPAAVGRHTDGARSPDRSHVAPCGVKRAESGQGNLGYSALTDGQNVRSRSWRPNWRASGANQGLRSWQSLRHPHVTAIPRLRIYSGTRPVSGRASRWGSYVYSGSFPKRSTN